MRRERFDKMNVVPFIDIVLVLLVIVLATATFVQNRTIQVALPSASSKQKLQEQEMVVIAIDKEGNYYYDKTPLSFDAIQKKLLLLNPADDLVSLHTDKETPFGFFVKIIDTLKARGFAHISIVTKE